MVCAKGHLMGKDHDPAVTHLVDQLMVIQHPSRGLVMDMDLARLRVRHAGLQEAKAPHLEPLVPLLMFFVGVQLLDDLPPTFQVFEVVRWRVDPVRLPVVKPVRCEPGKRESNMTGDGAAPSLQLAAGSLT